MSKIICAPRDRPHFQQAAQEITPIEKAIGIAVLDSLIAATTNGIEELNLRHDTGDGRTYNLMGQEVAPDTKGVVIRHGRKYVNR